MLSFRDLDLAFALQRLRPFSILQLSTLLLISRAAGKAVFEPGAEILPAGTIPTLLFAPIAGSATYAGRAIACAFDVPSLIFERRLAHPYLAGSEGCRAALLGKSHLFTLVRECPELLAQIEGTDFEPSSSA